MKSILFYWSKGAEVRRDIIKNIKTKTEEENPCFLNQIAEDLGKTHVAIKNHIDLLEEEGYIKKMNPDGKPVYLGLTQNGEIMAKELTKKKNT